jgi:hypothetical protein
MCSFHDCTGTVSDLRFSDEELYLLGYNAMKSGESQLTFRRNISRPSLRSKTSVAFHRTTRRHVTEDRALLYTNHLYLCVGVKWL